MLDLAAMGGRIAELAHTTDILYADIIAAIEELKRLRKEHKDVHEALDNCGFTSIYTDFDGPADAIRHMSLFIREQVRI